MRRKRGVLGARRILGRDCLYKGRKLLKNLMKCTNGGRRLKSLVIQSCFPQSGGRKNRKMSFLSWRGFTAKRVAPITRSSLETAAPQSAKDESKLLKTNDKFDNEATRKFGSTGILKKAVDRLV
ncbi:hypothetical protein ASD83_17470 [Devosia sp. Root685]|nr:hypothetical protein ASD83_17470 [Devosia sp. Root685]